MKKIRILKILLAFVVGIVMYSLSENLEAASFTISGIILYFYMKEQEEPPKQSTP